MDREGALLMHLAERPQDRSLRLVFSDWLQEQGDERGEVIALWERGSLSLTEQRLIAKITTAKARSWLGPLAAVADLNRTRFVGGFLDELVCAPNRRADLFDSLEGEPRLATVTSLAIPAQAGASGLGRFLGHKVLGGLERLEMGSPDWQRLSTSDWPHLRPARATVSSFGVFAQEIAPLAEVKVFRRAACLGLASTEFINPQVVGDLCRGVFSQQRALTGFEEVVLVARYGVLEGAAAWLMACDVEVKTAALPRLGRWGVDAGEVCFVRSREGGSAFRHLTIDLSAAERSSEKRASSLRPSTAARIATAASVLVLLGPARLRSVEVKLPEGARLRSHERHALYAAARRSGSLERFAILGENAFP